MVVVSIHFNAAHPAPIHPHRPYNFAEYDRDDYPPLYSKRTTKKRNPFFCNLKHIHRIAILALLEFLYKNDKVLRLSWAKLHNGVGGLLLLDDFILLCRYEECNSPQEIHKETHSFVQ
jgi:hypothetical protein